VISLRQALPGDIEAMRDLIERSSHALAPGHYAPEQIEAAIGTAWGVDSALVADGTFFVVESLSQVVGCGGWSRRAKLFGAGGEGEAPLLDPKTDDARIRAFFVDPSAVRQGIATLLLDRCESELLEHGFSAATLIATLMGVPFYSAKGYVEIARRSYPLPGDIEIEFVEMRRVWS
jgi:GNAT superfamily N-acetyltransferase